MTGSVDGIGKLLGVKSMTTVYRLSYGLGPRRGHDDELAVGLQRRSCVMTPNLQMTSLCPLGLLASGSASTPAPRGNLPLPGGKASLSPLLGTGGPRRGSGGGRGRGRGEPGPSWEACRATRWTAPRGRGAAVPRWGRRTKGAALRVQLLTFRARPRHTGYTGDDW